MPDRIRDLKPGQPLDSFFVVSSAKEGTTQRGSRFLTLSVSDATGTVQAKVWSPDAAFAEEPTWPGIYRLEGKVDSYRDEMQLQVDRATPYQPAPEEYDALVAASRWTGEALVAAIEAHIEAHVRAPGLRRLLLAALHHDDIRSRFAVSPAATANHHAYRSGLAEHTLSMMRLGTTIAAHYASYYPGLVDGDLLVAGTLLHDIGKVWELEGELATDYSTVGRLVGHIPMAAAFIARLAAEQGDVPDALVWELQHLILSHHGEYEYGSPKKPKTVEAQLLHYIDQIDARTNIFAMDVRKGGWTGWHRTMGRPLLDPTNLRTAWTTPPEGALREDGPGLERISPEHNDAPKTVDASAVRAPRSTQRAAAPGRRAEADAEPDAPTRTLSLFDGLDED